MVPATRKSIGLLGLVLPIALLLGLAGEVAPRPAWAAKDAAASASAPVISPAELEEAIRVRRLKVPEYAAIAEMARERGLKAYLFGGTASGLGHYVKWDLMREKGDTRFQPDRFDYDYTNIYRSNQDLDIVITRADGRPETVKDILEFQRAVAERFPYAQGNKTDWEVRGLKTKNGTKEAILDNPDFMNQHTDSNSVGLIELTEPRRSHVVLDLRDPKSKVPTFLKDVAEGKIHYYFSESHGATSRAAQGLNPPIISAIRYLTKALQYGLEIDPESRAHVEAIIQEFDPKSSMDGYVRNWIEKNGKKLFQNAVDIEYAWNTLEDLGLRSKLIALRSDARTQGSLAWWMSKEPLRTSERSDAHSFPAAKPEKTAGQLGIDVVAHETSGFEAYESITRSHQGKPNVLISRKSHAGELAAHGDGFYTQRGEKGATGSGFHIRFKVDSDAREGVDFIKSGTYLIWRNARKLTVIPEPLNLDPIEALKLLTQPQYKDELAFRQKLWRRLQGGSITKEQRAAFVAHVKSLASKRKWDEFAEGLSFPFTAEYPELLRLVPEDQDETLWKIKNIFAHPHWFSRPEVRKDFEAMLKSSQNDVVKELVQEILPKAHAQAYEKEILPLLKKVSRISSIDEGIVRALLEAPHVRRDRELIHWLAKDEDLSNYFIPYLDSPDGQDDVDLLKRLMSRAHSYDLDELAALFQNPKWATRLDLVESLNRKMDAMKVDKNLLMSGVLKANPEVLTDPKLLEKVLRIGKSAAAAALGEALFATPEGLNHLDLMTRLLQETDEPNAIQFLLAGAQEQPYPPEAKRKWAEILLRKNDLSIDADVASYLLSDPKIGDCRKWLEQLFKKNDSSIDRQIASWIFSEPHSRQYEDLLETLVRRADSSTRTALAAMVLSKPFWNHRGDLRMELLKSGGASALIDHLYKNASEHFPEAVEELPELARNIRKPELERLKKVANAPVRRILQNRDMKSLREAAAKEAARMRRKTSVAACIEGRL